MKLNRRRTTAKTKATAQKYIGVGSQWMLCRMCLQEEVEVGPDISAVTCSTCVQRMVPPPEIKVAAKIANGHEDYPRGWHLRKRFVATDGTVYERGKPAGESNNSGTKDVKPKSAAKRGRPKGSGKDKQLPPTGKRPRGRPRKIRI